jgi:hypothetical protein
VNNNDPFLGINNSGASCLAERISTKPASSTAVIPGSTGNMPVRKSPTLQNLKKINLTEMPFTCGMAGL